MNKPQKKNLKKSTVGVQKNKLDQYLKKKTASFYLPFLQEKINEENLNVQRQVIEPTPITTTTTIAATVESAPTVESEPTEPAIETHSDESYKIKLEILQQKYTDLKIAYDRVLQDNKQLKKLLNKSEKINLLKDIRLEKQASIERTQSNGSLFSGIEHSFSDVQIRHLMSIGSGKAKDATFVRQLINFLYPTDVGNICLSKKGGKTLISQENLALIESALDRRIRSEDVNESEGIERCRRMNTLIGYAISNLKKKENTEPIQFDEPVPQNQHSIPMPPTTTTPIPMSTPASTTIPMMHTTTIPPPMPMFPMMTTMMPMSPYFTRNYSFNDF